MSKHILLVDDDALMRRSLAFNLEQTGYRTSTAGSAEDGLNLARRDPPDLILLDIGLPGMDGLDALRDFQQQADTPIIFVTARRRELDQALGLELGFPLQRLARNLWFQNSALLQGGKVGHER